MRKRNYFFSAAILAAFVASLFAMPDLWPLQIRSNQALAQREVDTCAGVRGEKQKELCYEKNIPRLMDKGLPMERVFEIVAAVQSVDVEYQSCHVLAHFITAKEVQRDPSRWKGVVARSPVGICGNGAIHGAFQERFRESSFPDAPISTIVDMLAGVCDSRDGWNPIKLQQSSCVHGVGHLLLFVTDANVKKSIAACDEIKSLADRDLRQSCYEGVFMQLYQPLEDEDKALIYAIEDEAKQTKSFCAQFGGDAHSACVKESWAAIPGSASTPDGFEALCKQLGNREEVEYCAIGLMFPVIEELHYDIPTVKKFCNDLSDQGLQRICWARTAVKLIWADWRNVSRSLSVCRDAPEEFKDSCWTELAIFAHNGFSPDSPQLKELCSGMPSPWRDSCASKTYTIL